MSKRSSKKAVDLPYRDDLDALIAELGAVVGLIYLAKQVMNEEPKKALTEKRELLINAIITKLESME